VSVFRINIYLTIKNFFLSFFISEIKKTKKIIKFFSNKSQKKNIILTSQLRVGFILVLKYLKKISPDRKEIIISAYNLAEMVNICKNLNLKIVHPKLNKNLFLCENDLRKKINKKTLAVVTTNIFNSYSDSRKIKKICNIKKIPLIEDNAIYFGNFKKINNKKIYTGSFGDYSLNSFNIMKNISAMYGGSIETNDKHFTEFANKELNSYKKFPLIKFLTQSLIFLILKTISIKLIYKLFFFNLIKKATIQKNLFILSLVYPSLKFKKKPFPNYYFTKMNYISKNMIYLQINDVENFNENHIAKKKNNAYYLKVFKNKKIANVQTLNNEDSNFQNYNDFPIFVTKKNDLVNYLFSKGVETKTIQYVDCQKIFKSYKNNNNSIGYENKIICLPNHKKITHKYINHVVSCVDMFYKNS